mgnify:CR=1 FL=1
MELHNLLISEGTLLSDSDKSILPSLFNDPFSYSPHPLVVEVSHKVFKHLLESDSRMRRQLSADGKMFGVLVVQTPSGKIGYLAAYSGTHEDLREDPYFVPPVYDLLSPDSFFPSEEHEIVMLNDLIRDLENDRYRFIHIEVTEEIRQSHLEKIAGLQEIYEQGKVSRSKRRGEILELLRSAGDSGMKESLSAELEAINRESQFQKGEIRRAEKRMKEEIAARDAVQAESDARIDSLKEKRKEMSGRLQQKIFEHFSFLNAYGERKGLLEIFGDSTPPAGTGECAAPRLLQYAYLNGYKPVAMGEFWYGYNDTHVEGQFYPSCKGKCGPVLEWMLQGLKVDPAGRHSTYGCGPLPDSLSALVLYEDDSLLAVNKPAGILSAPGRSGEEMDILQLLSSLGYPVEGLRVAHRLDMHTSGVLLIAKNETVYKQLQREFVERKVVKVYEAVLDGEVSPATTGSGVVWKSSDEGRISLPLAADFVNRPLQKVDFDSGKVAITDFRILRIAGGRTYIEFYPVTGRTHQLRLHSSSPLGLGAPIVGDFLYGSLDKRLMLNALKVTSSFCTISCKSIL